MKDWPSRVWGPGDFEEEGAGIGVISAIIGGLYGLGLPIASTKPERGRSTGEHFRLRASLRACSVCGLGWRFLRKRLPGTSNVVPS